MTNTKKKILVVEDEELFKGVVEQAFAADGLDCELTWCATGAKAIKVMSAAEQPFDLMLLDLVLPDTTGTVLTQQFRSDFAVSCPIIVVSAYGSHDDVVTAMKAGANDYIKKPFDFGTLIKKMRAYL